MKFTKAKILTIISGLLTLSGLAMLFSGLVIQMSENADFAQASLNTNGSTDFLIFMGVLVAVTFGTTFFDGWARIKTKNGKHVKFA